MWLMILSGSGWENLPDMMLFSIRTNTFNAYLSVYVYRIYLTDWTRAIYLHMLVTVWHETKMIRWYAKRMTNNTKTTYLNSKVYLYVWYGNIWSCSASSFYLNQLSTGLPETQFSENSSNITYLFSQNIEIYSAKYWPFLYGLNV